MIDVANKISKFIELLSETVSFDDEELNKIVELLSLYEVKKISIDDYLKEEYNNIFNKWKQTFPMFDIPNGILSFSVNGIQKHVKVGNIEDNALFDLASITKLYTEVILLKIIDRKDYNITLNTKLSDITSLYPNLDKDLRVLDLISFNNTYRTQDDVREATNKEEALRRLRTCRILPEYKGYYLYTDIPLMILTDILEDYTKLSYKELFDKYIVKELNLKDTFLILSNEDKNRYVGYDKNTVNDPKANIMGGYYGHAGVKTTSSDLLKFMDSIFNTFSNDIFNILISPTNTRNLNYYIDGTKIEAEDKDIANYNKHLLTRGKGLIGNFNIQTPKETLKDYTYSSLTSDSLSNKGFAVQGSTRTHTETSIIEINNKKYNTSITILLDISNQYENAKEYEKISGKIITKEGKCDYNGTYYMTDIRAILPYKEYYKDLVNAVSRCRILEIYLNY